MVMRAGSTPTSTVGEEAAEVGEPLAQAEARKRPERRLRQAEHGEVAARPAVPLQQVSVHVKRRETLDEDLVVVVGRPSRPVHLDGRVEVLGDRVGGHPADLD
jgi:hypothetical protein